MALRTYVVFFIGTAVGSVLPEFGDVLAVHLKIEPHFFNVFFLFLGIIGCVLSYLIGRKSSR